MIVLSLRREKSVEHSRLHCFLFYHNFFFPKSWIFGHDELQVSLVHVYLSVLFQLTFKTGFKVLISRAEFFICLIKLSSLEHPS